MGDPPILCFHENTPVQYIKEAVTLKRQTESEDNQTISISFFFPLFFDAHRQTETHTRSALQNR